MKPPDNGTLADGSPTGEAGEKKNINSELWHACAGPLVSLPPVGTLVVYFPQGHSEQVAATMQKEMDTIPNYPSLPSQLICVLHSATLHADAETDEVYAQMTLQPINKYDKEGLLASDLGLKQNRQPAEFFCKTLTASDTSTHGGFSVPRRAAEKIFPPLDFSKQPPAQELVAKDLHDVSWTFRHVYRGQPKRHLLTTGWSVFVSTKRLVAGDSVLFIRDEKSRLLLGIRRSNRQQPALSSSVLSTDSMHIGVLAAAAHAAANNSPFTIFYNPRASPSEFVIPLAKYNKAMYSQVSLGMRFRMMFETEESGVRRYMGTITGISDLDPVQWKGSQWRSLQVGWDESTTGERRNRVSVWEIDPVVSPFYICPPPFFRPKLATPDNESDVENAFKHVLPWLGNDGLKDSQNPMLSGISLVQWMSMQRNPLQMSSASQSSFSPSVMASALRNSSDESSMILNFQSNASPLSNLQFNIPKSNPVPQTDGKQPASLVLTQPQLQQQLLLQQQQQLLQQPQQVQQPRLLQHQQLVQQHQQFQPQLHMQQQEHRQQQDRIAILTQQQHLQKASDISSQQLQQAVLHQLLQQQQQQQQQLSNHQHANNHVNQEQQISLQHHVLEKQHAASVHLVQGQQLEQSAPKHVPKQDCQLHPSQQQQLKSPAVGAAAVDLLQQKPQKSNVQTVAQDLPLANQLIQSSQPQVQLEATMSVTSNPCIQQLSSLPGNSGPSQSTLSPNLQFPNELVSQQTLSQQQQQQLQQIASQVELLQKLQQQQQQQQHMLSLCDPKLLSHLTQQQLPILQKHVLQHKPLGQQQPGGMLLADPLKGQPTNCFSPANHTLPFREKPTLPNDPLHCSNSEHNISAVQPMHLFQKIKERVVPTDKAINLPNNMIQEDHCRPLALNKAGQHSYKMMPTEQQNYKTIPAHLSYQDAMADQLDASSSATSFCMDKSGEESFSVPLCLDGDEQGNNGNHLVYGSVDGLMPETLCSTGFGSGKDLQHVLSGYGHQRDIETEISTAAISSQSFGVRDKGFRPEFSNDAVVHDNGLISKGSWPSQPRMRTYTKVQKRGSVGRCIDLARYRGYEQLRRDLACMFGIDGQLEDPHRSDWKLVYVDHEKDVLLVGDDPWEEFVSCVQSLKILSAVEVQQMSLDGDLGGIPAQTQACSGSDNNGNLWRAHYDSHSAGSDR